jgi:hypothetical protein
MRKKPVFLFMAAWLLGACTFRKEELTVSCDLPETVSFSRDVLPVFNAHCNTAGCHSGALPTGGLNLEPDQAWDQLHQPGSGYIDTVMPSFSLLYAQMTSVSNPMPPSGHLDSCTQSMILKWIGQKAPNN